MEHKKPGFWFFFKEIAGYLFTTVFSLCLAIGMKNSGADTGFILFACDSKSSSFHSKSEKGILIKGNFTFVFNSIM